MTHNHLCRCCILAETTGEGRSWQCSDADCEPDSELECAHCAADGERDLCASAEDYL